MNRTDENIEDAWRTARTLWIKYCGISDEYKMLRDRWLYLHGEQKLMVLPYLRRYNKDEEMKTFDLLDEHTKELEKKFIDLGFKRAEMENFDAFKREVIEMDITDLISEMKLTEDYFFDLANFVGLLKSAFFQRTVSAEIQHVVSGVPHSPERTIGNELFYLAADNVARRYCECLNIPYGKWDGFITFIPPIEEGYFYGAFYNPSPYLELFHVSMSEEAKYFVGSYLALAHEFGHAVMKRKIKKIDGSVELRRAAWMHSLFSNIYKNTIEVLIDKKKKRCEDCPLYNYLTTITNMDPISTDFEDLMADIIAVNIGGLNYIHSFIDFAYNMVSNPYNQPPFLLRTISSYYYLKLKNFRVTDLEARILKIVEEAKEIREKSRYSCPLGSDFFDCVTGICAMWAKNIDEFNENFGKIVSEGLIEYINNFPHLVYLYSPFRGSITTEEMFKEENLKQIFTLISPEKRPSELFNTRSELFSMVVKSKYKFKIGKREEDEIVNALLEGSPIPEKDPRHILHSYYEAYKRSEGEERPHYAATIYSLAFNTFTQNKRER